MKWLKLLLFLSVALVVFPSISFADTPTSSDCYAVADFGSSEVNGDYTFVSSHNGVPAYGNGTSFIFIDHSSFPPDYWVIKDDLSDGSGGYYFAEIGTQRPSEGSWSVGGYSSPAGTVTLVTCAGGGGGEGGTATSSPMTYHENLLIYCIIIFYLSLFGWGFMFSLFKTIP